MEEALLDLARTLESTSELDERALTRLLNRHNKRLRAQKTPDRKSTEERPLSKRALLTYLVRVQRENPKRWQSWGISPEVERKLRSTLQMKPRRTASGVATVTVLTKPWPCHGSCRYCPNDLRMPKSYLAAEPACQRAERACFDPYLQVTSRVRVLEEMGHITDKVELIVLGGTWHDYPAPYRLWFIQELFRALNDAGTPGTPDANAGASPDNDTPAERQERYRHIGISGDPDKLAAEVAKLQTRIDSEDLSYNDAFAQHYPNHPGWQQAAQWQQGDWDALDHEQRHNENAAHRVVGLVIETRPACINPASLTELRKLGCTKVQLGSQSLDDTVLSKSSRDAGPTIVTHALNDLRLFGFKTHVHAMVNLPGSTPAQDIDDYRRLMDSPAFRPDEVKLYPCVLVAGTPLEHQWHTGAWKPYTEEELVEVLATDTCATPAWTRISRMIRDICAPDIVAGNKKVNLRQLVEARIEREGNTTAEIRHREMGLTNVDATTLHLDIVPYNSTATHEHFLQWIDDKGQIAGFLRLSLPDQDIVRERKNDLPIKPGEAMIREVHVYGRVARLNTKGGTGAQHRGLGTQLVERACTIAREAGFTTINVISAVGTRGYYRRLGFYDHGLYQQRTL